MQYNPDEIVALDARKFTLRTALKNFPDQIGPMAALWRERGLEPSFFDAEDIIQLRTRMALEEYANALRAPALGWPRLRQGHARVLRRRKSDQAR
jgi:hypothetical protein